MLAAGCEPDSVDGCPERQADITLEELRQLLGDETMDRLMMLPTLLSGDGSGGGGGVGNGCWRRVGSFVRRYTVEDRCHLAFHILSPSKA